ncbi:MAG TPA: DUF262 domain-containing protein [Anaerohalosphaeraceae bacterium]|nr:DUF262 domain-containing protein [Anaerohalosphaeraceae bacterium]HOL32109.1 DUF262 domain-containing protein [Anaerohalosphaeraceae bacterium]HOM77162.1 DUF262 domain-containing protein [Anaerohalosphaeraceae bacterium]HPC65451.1 DUF262 domain-containing protein [Anaerohalosphaeraceae bacterium]HPO70409.1 DUF262 domain-containing protein [Anaerohalosphaeraceae bacterium]
MKIELKEITVRQLADGYADNAEEGVVGFGGKLDIRPPYQREFIYKDKQRDAVITTLINDFPLNVMYWAVREDGKFEIIDGQQRTISICQYVNGEFSYEKRYFHNLKDDEKEQILNYKLMVYFCSGTDSEKLDWFRTINIAGEKLTDQELRNAVYAGTWVTDAKRYFSKTGCPAYQIASDYLNGSPIRQEYLETAIKWISNDHIEEYMAQHQHDQNAGALWRYFQDVITWVSTTFTKKRKFMKGVDWGTLYNTYKDKTYDTKKIEEETARLILDDDVTKKSGIYPYILTRDEKYLSIRTFSDAMKQKVYERQKGICEGCKKHFEIEEMEADHITPWREGGKTTEDNCQMLCRECNRRKSGR